MQANEPKTSEYQMIAACAEHVRLLALNAQAITALEEIETRHDEPEHVDGVIPGKGDHGE